MRKPTHLRISPVCLAMTEPSGSSKTLKPCCVTAIRKEQEEFFLVSNKHEKYKKT